jgi:hypothetical protein
MSSPTRLVLRIAIVLLVLCTVGLLVLYAILRPVRAIGPASRRTATPTPGPAAELTGESRPTFLLNPDAGSPGQTIQVSGRGFAPGASIALHLGVPNAGLRR